MKTIPDIVIDVTRVKHSYSSSCYNQSSYNRKPTNPVIKVGDCVWGISSDWGLVEGVVKYVDLGCEEGKPYGIIPYASYPNGKEVWMAKVQIDTLSKESKRIKNEQENS